MPARTDCADVRSPDARSLPMVCRSLRKGLSVLPVLSVLLVLLVLFEDASFSSDVRAVVASVVFPDCRAVLRVFKRESMLDVVDDESVDDVLPVSDELSEEY